MGDMPDCYAREWLDRCGRGATFLLSQLVEASAIPEGVGRSELSALVPESVYRARSVELFFGGTEYSGAVARLPCPPDSLVGLGHIFRVVSSLWSVVIAVPAIPIIRETGSDHVGSSVIVEVPPGSLPSSVGSSVSIVVIDIL